MVRASIVQLVLFITAISVSALFAGVVVTESGLYAQSAADEHDRAVGAINAKIDSINDAGANATYNESDGEVTLYVKNVGGGSLEPAAADVLLNGVYVQPSGAVVDSERDQWRVGTVLELTITVEESLEAGEHRAVVEIESARAILTFDVE